MRIHQLEVFCHVYEQRSVSGAGQVLRLSQPAVSMQVRQLEQELGIQLFERLGRQLVPTQAAHALYGYAAVIRGAFSEAQRMMAEFRDGQRGTIHLGASTTGVIYYLPALLRDFRRRYPDTVVTVEADLTERVRDGVVQGRIAMGLVWGPCHDERLSEERLLQAEFVPVFAADHPLLQQPQIQARDLQNELFILPGDEHSATRRFIVARLHEAGVDPRVLGGARSTEEVKQAVAAGLGVGVVASRAARLELAAGTLVSRPISGLSLPPRPIVLITLRHRPLGTAAATHLIQHMRQRASTLQEGLQ